MPSKQKKVGPLFRHHTLGPNSKLVPSPRDERRMGNNAVGTWMKRRVPRLYHGKKVFLLNSEHPQYTDLRRKHNLWGSFVDLSRWGGEHVFLIHNDPGIYRAQIHQAPTQGPEIVRGVFDPGSRRYVYSKVEGSQYADLLRAHRDVLNRLDDHISSKNRSDKGISDMIRRNISAGRFDALRMNPPGSKHRKVLETAEVKRKGRTQKVVQLPLFGPEPK